MTQYNILYLGPCETFELVSTGPAKQAQPKAFSTYVKQNTTINGKILYYNPQKGLYLYWLNKSSGVWMVSLLFVLSL